MFKFFNSQKKKITNYEKGILFESFVKKILEISNYEIIEERPKYEIGELDLTAVSKLDSSHKIIIEAKAKEKKIVRDIINSFVGKLLLFWDKNQQVTGLLISISDLTADAKTTLKAHKKKRSIDAHIGFNIFKKLSSNQEFLSLKEIQTICKKVSNMILGDTFFGICDRGFFFIQLLIPLKNTIPKYFFIIRPNGEVIEDRDFYEIVNSRINELKSLSPHYILEDIEKTDQKSQKIGKYLTFEPSPGRGKGWFDYKLPAPPEYFIGRKTELRKFEKYFNDYIEKKTKISIVQILSRSGVGKTSFIIKLKSDYEKLGFFTAFTDAREISSTLDIIKITQYLFNELDDHLDGNLEIPLTIDESSNFFIKVNKHLKKITNFLVIFIDQFEIFILRSNGYSQYFDFFFEIANRLSNIYLVIARKSDTFISTEENIKFDFERLINSSYPINLPDFNKSEALEMISKLEEYFKKKVKKELVKEILEKSDGFPWLHKRLCNHVLNLYNKGSSQDDIIKAGLSIGDLFKEELEQLDELERNFLKKIISFLPLSINELNEQFQNEINFKERIRKFKNLRLLRLTANTLDTYNDFFKEYVLNGTIPIRPKYILKRTPNTIEKWFKLIFDKKYDDIDLIVEHESIQKGSLYNNLKDMRNLNLLDLEKGKLVINPDLGNKFNIDNYKQFIKSQIIKNDLLNGKNGIIDISSRKSELELLDVTQILKNKFQYIECEEKTWKKYSQVLIQWIRYCGLNEDLNINIVGNILQNKREKKYFFPEISIHRLNEIISEFLNFIEIPKIFFLNKARRNDKALFDLQTINFLEKKNDKYYMTRLGKEYLQSSKIKKREIISNICYSWPNIRDYLEKIKNNDTIDAFEIFQALKYVEQWSKSTKEMFFRKLKSWLIYSRLVFKSNSRLIHKDKINSILNYIKSLD